MLKKLVKMGFINTKLAPYCLRIGFVSTVWGICAICAAADVKVLRHCITANNGYLESVVQMALSYSDTEYKLENLDEKCIHVRQVDDLDSEKIAFMWAGTTKELEEQALPVRIPIYKGLLGYRIFIIRQGEQTRFDQVETLTDLRQFSLGQGRLWADIAVLEAAGFNVIKGKYWNMFPMLEGGRFDAFPRGVQEPWDEIAERPKLKLVIESKLAIVYPMAAYLFVSLKNEKLARELEAGLNAAIKDGSFDRNFYSDPSIKKVLTQSDLKNRKIFRIENPFLPVKTPLQRQELWMKISDL